MQGPRYIVSKFPKASTKQGSKLPKATKGIPLVFTCQDPNAFLGLLECDCNVVWDLGCCLLAVLGCCLLASATSGF